MARLGDAFITIRNGASIKQTEGAGGFPITRIETISNREVDRNKFGYAGIDDIKKYRDYILQDDDILMSHINSEKHLGKSAIYHKMGTEQVIHGMNLLMLRANPKIIYPQYALYYFDTPYFKQQIIKITKKSVNQASFTVTALKEMEIPLPTIEVQKNIAGILDRVSDLMFLRKQQLAKLDELVKARFVEMFEDISESNYVEVKDVCSIITDGTHQPPKFVKTGIPFLFVSNIVGNVITYDAEKFISGDTYDELIKRTPIEIGDILLSTVGSYGHPAIVKSKEKFCFQRHIAYLKPKHELIDSVYFHGALLSANVQTQIENRVKGIAQKTLNLSEIRTITLPLPSLDEQRKFAIFSQKADESKLTIQQSLDKLEVLKKSLMQEYFG